MNKLARFLAAPALAAVMGVRAESPAASPLAAEPPAQVTADQAPPEKWPTMAEAGDPLAQALLARAYLLGTDGKAANPKEADAWARRSAGQKHPLGLFLRGWCCRYDRTRLMGAREEAAKSFFGEALAADFEEHAEQGGRQWLAVLGAAHCYGFGMPENQGDAVKCWRKAADLGDANAMFRLGLAYAMGNGVPVDEKSALQWYCRAAALGETGAMVYIGKCYCGGIGVAKDAAAAVEWYRKAADQGSSDAMYFLGCCYVDGSGVPKGEPDGVKWLLKAADAGFTPAMRTLGDCCKDGRGVPIDKEEAAKWYRQAAALGDGLSEDRLKELKGAK
ncbi:MAG: tetratricopeptide repeat protein [Verrucomicrobia bacterium]|nr:tetratricopeptide repeat protein [Verrucomicrobiota bacterium]